MSGDRTTTGGDFSLVLGTNIWSPHMVPLARALANRLGDGFKMAIFQAPGAERVNMGWADVEERPKWLHGPPRTELEASGLNRLCSEAGVTVLGAVPTHVLESRARTGKLTFVASERLLKRRFHRIRMLSPRYAHSLWRYRRIVNRPNMHALAIGHYAPADLAVLGLFPKRVWRWSYFIELNPHPPAPRKPERARLLWVGRMLDWKRVDLLIRAIARVQHEPWFGGCSLVGDGPERGALMRLSDLLHIRPDAISFRPPVPLAQVRDLMREHDIYVLPSNRKEGWGAVAAEAMSEGAVLVASDEAGAARVLVRHRQTGYLFPEGDVSGLVRCIAEVSVDSDARERTRQAAWRAMQNTWSSEVGADRILSLARSLLTDKRTNGYESGLCAPCGEA